jgi:hypothetical protein
MKDPHAVQAAKEIGLDERQSATLELAAMFHDIGHMGVPEWVLNKPGQLNADEWEVVRKHPLLRGRPSWRRRGRGAHARDEGPHWGGGSPEGPS